MTVKEVTQLRLDCIEKLRVLSSHWVSKDTFLLPPEKRMELFTSLVFTSSPILFDRHAMPEDRIEIPLIADPKAFSPDLRQKYPHLGHYIAYRLASEIDPHILRNGLRGAHFLVLRDDAGAVVDMCGLQIPGAVDDLIHYDGQLGVEYGNAMISLRLWAPLARKVKVGLFKSSTDADPIQILEAELRESEGLWEVSGPRSWDGMYYLFQVENYYPIQGRILREWVTDPYSVGLSCNSKRSLIVDLNDNRHMPDGWKKFTKPTLDAFEDMAIYELHVRDFSASDPTVATAERGTFKAFLNQNSSGMTHLKKIADAGITHIQLMPVSDFTSAEEDRSKWINPDDTELTGFTANSNQQAEMISKTLGMNGYNWGYDPYHFSVPEGSYSTDPNGPVRIFEFRQMIMALGQIGLRVVMDVVYNHTFADGLDGKSVLDKAVPGYYHRLDYSGRSERSTCCPNTASENRMATKLMIDSLLIWAKHYKVDGFRFDLMGHIMLTDMRAALATLRALDLDEDGVDGAKLCLYGEGWDFGEVANNTRGINASIKNIAGTGIGVFNDRVRDALRGGAAFGNIFEQGFATGLFSQPNSNESRDHETQRWRLMEHCDLIKISLAGSVRSFKFSRAGGETLRADQIWYNGQLAGFSDDPEENILYVSAHDNETLWDVIQMKTAPYIANSDRVRMNNLALAVIALGQGIPFFHAGDDLLRSKSLDRNSYNAGDWYNRIDWTYETNNWGVGLPLEGKENWHYFSYLLGDPKRIVSRKEIQFAAENFQLFLKIRNSSPLFRLRTAEQINHTVYFLNNGPSQIPGLIVYGMQDGLGLDEVYDQIVVLLNANPGAVYFGDASFVGKRFGLHPTQSIFYDEILTQASFNSQIGEFKIPGRTAVVFVSKRKTSPVE